MISLSGNVLLPTTLMCLIFAALPSAMLIDDLDAVAIEVDDRRLDRDVVLAAVVVLARELLRDSVEREPVERLRLRPGRCP